MPQLEQFEAGSGQINVPDRGAEAFAQEGRRVGAFFHQIGQDTKNTLDVYHAHQVDMDVGNTLTAQSNADVNAHKQLMDLVNDPRAADHPEMGQALIEQYTKAQNDIVSHASTEEGKRLGQRQAAERIDQFSQRVASEMSILAGAKGVQNFETYSNNSAFMAAQDPSRLPNLLADLQEHGEIARPHNLSPEGVAQYEAAVKRSQAQTALAGYIGGIHAGEDQIANGQPATALDAVQKMLDGGIGKDVIGDSTAAIQEKIDTARAQGAARFRQRQNDAVEGQKREGAAAYAQIDTQVSNFGTPDQKFTLEQLMQARSEFATKYGASNPGEVHALNDSIDRLRQLQADHKLDTGDGGVTFGGLQARLSITPGQAGYISDQELAGDWRANKISTEEFRMAREYRDKAATDPAMKAGLEMLKAFQAHMLTGLVAPGSVAPGRGQASAAFIADSTRTFNDWIKSGKLPDEAVKIMEDPTNNRNFMQGFKLYQRAAMRTSPIDYLRKAGADYYNAQAAAEGVAAGSVAAPIHPTVGQQAPPKISQDAVNKMF